MVLFTGKQPFKVKDIVICFVLPDRSNSSDEAVITWRQDTDHIFGSFKFMDGRSFGIEKCHQGYVLKRFDLTSFPQEQSFPLSQEQQSSSSVSQALANRGQQDNTTLVTYYVMIYYTPQVRGMHQQSRIIILSDL